MMSAMATGPMGEFAEAQIRLAALVADVAQGDERALASLYDALGGIVYGLVLRMVRDASAAEEIALEVFLQLWRSAASYSSSRGTVIGWLAVVARSRAVDWLRSPAARVARQKQALDHVEAMAAPEPDPERACLEERRARAIRQGLERLPAEQRDVIELAFYGGLSHSEIAGRLGQPLGTVKSRIRLGMSQLRGVLGAEMEGA